MLTYNTLIDRLFNVNLFGGMKFGLDNCLCLSKALNHPEEKFPSVHVAGSNGKGSVCTKIAKGCQKNGLKVGLYTSPHISSFRERICINGEMITEEHVQEGLSLIFQIIENHQITATFFEITTFLAFWYFAQQNVDIAIIEVGLGGRLDATNILKPKLSIITSVSLEHTEILGDTIEKIALEKAGIIKEKTPILIGPKVPLETIQKVANIKRSPLIRVEGTFSTFELENQAISKQALELLGISSNAILKGIETVPNCRFQEVLYKEQLVILDVAHNPDGFERLFQRVRLKYPQHKMRILFGLSKTKDITKCLSILNSHTQHFYPVEAPNGRGVSPSTLKEMLEGLGVVSKNICLQTTIEQNLQEALKATKKENEVLLVCGTFFIMSKVRAQLGFNEPTDFIDMNERNRS